MHRTPDILVYTHRLIGSPDKSAGEEGDEEHDAVVELCPGSSHLQFVKEPVEVQEWGGELVENEGTSIEVDEWSLYID